MTLVDHVPQGNPCTKCDRPASSHRVYHAPDADPCKCGLPARNHRPRWERSQKGQNHSPAGVKPEPFYVGIDGEGFGRDALEKMCPPCREAWKNDGTRLARTRAYQLLCAECKGRVGHRYVFLGACDESGGRRWHAESSNGLSSEQCLEMILSLPKHAKVFAFSFNYDVTMMLRDLPNNLLYKLFRPELRRPKRPAPGEKKRHSLYPVKWLSPSGVEYRVNMMGAKFTVSSGEGKAKRSRTVWDIFRFYQSKFTNALEDWKAAPPDAIKRMKEMKDNRGNFDRFYQNDAGREQVWQYCFDECRYMAGLAHMLVDAHRKVGLELKTFFGAGSSASAMLKKMGLKEKIITAPEEMRVPLARAFFGGRFENSMIGMERGEVHNYDISSAYPYQLVGMPCLVHGTWRRAYKRSEMLAARAALVRYRLKDPARKDRWGRKLCDAWGPFPFRDEEGSISFPRESPGGDIWRDEFLAGESIFPGVEFRSAWVLEGDCDCRPFEEIANYYVERVRIGKEGPGIVLKLGTNSVYGKLAQSVGEAPFNSWIWAGMITSGCRAQILQMFPRHENPENLLMIATDGVFTREEINPPDPKDTGTSQTGKPLGGWEHKAFPRGIFMARPGIYFPLSPTEDEIKAVRGRGIGKATVLQHWKTIVDGWTANPTAEAIVRICKIVRFCGTKSSITRSGPKDMPLYRRADGTKSAVKYGEWVERDVELSFNPMPKRAGIARDGRSLILRKIDGATESYPYTKALVSREARELIELANEVLEQPDADLAEYD